MRITFDLLGSPAKSGGMRMHATSTIESWLAQWPDDHVQLIGAPWVRERFGTYPNTSFVLIENDRAIRRSFGQLVVSPTAARRHRSEWLVSFSPIVSPFAHGLKTACFQHDWRHLRQPEEFSRAHHIYRHLWVVSAQRADVTACISMKALRETREIAAKSNAVLVENGRDHAGAWKVSQIAPLARPFAVTFGHHNNKRPELVISAISKIRQGATPIDLVVLGASGTYRSTLEQLAEDLGIKDHIVFPGFVSDDEYADYVAHASCVVMASTDEGFGLPIGEAQYRGIPAIVTAGSGMDEIFADYAIVVAPESQAIADALQEAVGPRYDRTAPKTGADAELFTWFRTAEHLRLALSQHAVS